MQKNSSPWCRTAVSGCVWLETAQNDDEQNVQDQNHADGSAKSDRIVFMMKMAHVIHPFIRWGLVDVCHTVSYVKTPMVPVRGPIWLHEFCASIPLAFSQAPTGSSAAEEAFRRGSMSRTIISIRNARKYGETVSLSCPAVMGPINEPRETAIDW